MTVAAEQRHYRHQQKQEHQREQQQEQLRDAVDVVPAPLQSPTCTSSSSTTIFCLNFASARHPGGGFLNGSQAQEESLARASGLYACLTQPGPQEQYYKVHNNDNNNDNCSPFGYTTDTMIYSPKVPVFKDDHGALLETPVMVSFLTAAAVDQRTGNSNNTVVSSSAKKNNKNTAAAAAGGDGGVCWEPPQDEVESIMKCRIAKSCGASLWT
ncbi:hypothetical protein ACA910_007845 [Epithemia clementina (nom. ined.)]